MTITGGKLMYTKDQMIQLTYQIEKNINELAFSEEEGMNHRDDNKRANYWRTKKRKGDEIEQILNCRIMEFHDGYAYRLPKEFVALWAFLLADFTISSDATGTTSMKDILKALKPTATMKDIPTSIIDKLRIGLQASYRKVYGDEINEIDTHEVIEMQLRAIQENYHFNCEKKKIENEIQHMLKEAFNSKLAQPNQYTVERSKEYETELYPFGELTFTQQVEKMTELKDQIRRQLEEW